MQVVTKKCRQTLGISSIYTKTRKKKNAHINMFGNI